MTIDTNIIIAYLAGEGSVVDAIITWRRESRVLFLPTVVETEILSFSKWTSEEKLQTEKFLEENFVSVSFDRLLARQTAEIRKNYKLKFPDGAIAATALYTNSPLVTRNVRDFKRVPSLQLVTI